MAWADGAVMAVAATVSAAISEVRVNMRQASAAAVRESLRHSPGHVVVQERRRVPDMAAELRGRRRGRDRGPAGITGRLDYLAALGVDVVWLSPIYPSPQDDAGYDICDYQDIDPTFGSLRDFDALLAALHARGMKLVMDLVVNHTSDEHPWFVESRSSRESPKRDWYWWRPHEPARDGWGSSFSGPAWHLDEATGEYFLHIFSRKQPDLNWENPEVREAIYSMMGWWLDRGVDGFRMDVVNFISKDTPGTCPNVHGEALSGAPGSTSTCRRCTAPCSRGGARLLTVGEMPGVTVEEARLFTDPGRGEVDMVFQFEHVQLDHGDTKWDLHRLRLHDLKDHIGPLAGGPGRRRLEQPVLEQPRPAADRVALRRRRRVPRTAAKMLGTVLHMHRGTPYVYQGEELGMTNAPFARIEDFRDIESLNHYAEAVAEGADADDVLSACARWAATTRARRCSGTPARTRGSRPASRGSASIRTTSRSTPRPRAPTPTRSSTTTGG